MRKYLFQKKSLILFKIGLNYRKFYDDSKNIYNRIGQIDVKNWQLKANHLTSFLNFEMTNWDQEKLAEIIWKKSRTLMKFVIMENKYRLIKICFLNFDLLYSQTFISTVTLFVTVLEEG